MRLSTTSKRMARRRVDLRSISLPRPSPNEVRRPLLNVPVSGAYAGNHLSCLGALSRTQGFLALGLDCHQPTLRESHDALPCSGEVLT